MSDETNLKISDPHRVPVTFVNDIAGSGHANGVVNITLVTALFTPTDNKTVDVDLAISSRLRMDLYCAQRMYDALGEILKQNTKPTGTQAN